MKKTMACVGLSMLLGLTGCGESASTEKANETKQSETQSSSSKEKDDSSNSNSNNTMKKSEQKVSKKETYTDEKGTTFTRVDYALGGSKQTKSEMDKLAKETRENEEKTNPVLIEINKTSNGRKLTPEWITGYWKGLSATIFFDISADSSGKLTLNGQGRTLAKHEFVPVQKNDKEWQGDSLNYLTDGELGSTTKGVKLKKMNDNLFRVEAEGKKYAYYVRSSKEESDRLSNTYQVDPEPPNTIDTGHFMLKGDWIDDKLGIHFTFHPKDEVSGYIDGHEDGVSEYKLLNMETSHSFTIEYQGKNGKKTAFIQITEDKKNKETYSLFTPSERGSTIKLIKQREEY
ncbi:hypothetical protein [Bacillus cereus]|uniref:Lipoprotein n=1 Tax=Bacillus cereus TaxID=1396 RepID=A0A162PDD6_BACCE|nr:hypothetical protein [Bacillus cereus]KZD71222.1 hypothetical protein B4088_0952 [Bacillus cereus]HDR8321308.1 hypothetical protein [Bacillus cereus]HDR8330244.1 hypothetical protein [Bacillus cereus]HDR8334295.1 hypothetical protein [Bacillus cereus]